MDVKAVKQEFDHKQVGGIHIIQAQLNSFDGMLGSHWHEELELVYTYQGNHDHYINGEHFKTAPGVLLAVNSNFVHSIVPEKYEKKTESSLAALIIIIDPDFLKTNFPEYENIYFTNDNLQAGSDIKKLTDALLPYSISYADGKGTLADHDPYGRLHRNALVTELLYLLCQNRTAARSEQGRGSYSVNIEKMKEIITYIEKNYAMPLTRQNVAEKFYMSQNYFSSYFKKYVGLTFTGYLTNYRLTKAKDELLSSDKSVGRIALECGFPDDRSFIIAFKKRFDETPLRYRKENSPSQP